MPDEELLKLLAPFGLAVVLGAAGHRYPPGAYAPYPHFPPPGAYPPGPPGPGSGHPVMFPLRDASHEHPSLLPPPPEPGAGGGQPPPPPPLPPGLAGGSAGSANRPSLPHRPAHWSSMPGYQRPMEDMVDITNELGVSVLQDYAYSRGNFAFSPYGVVSVLVVLYEGARGETARQVHTTLKLPWDRDVLRVGFRDIHRNLKSYFSHEGYLSGVTLSQSRTALIPEFRRVLRFYGYDVDMPAVPDGNASTNASAVLSSPQITSGKRPQADAPGTPSTPAAAGATSPTTTTTTTTTSTSTTSSTTSTSFSLLNAFRERHGSTFIALFGSEAGPTTASDPSSAPSSAPPSTEAESAVAPTTTTAPPTTSATTSPTSTTAGVVQIAENEVEQEVERIDGTDSPLSLLNPSLLQQKFPGILMGSKLQEQLNSLFPEGLPESRVDDVDDTEAPPSPTAAEPAPPTAASSADNTEADLPAQAESSTQQQGEAEEVDPEPAAETTWSSETTPALTTTDQADQETQTTLGMTDAPETTTATESAESADKKIVTPSKVKLPRHSKTSLGPVRPDDANSTPCRTESVTFVTEGPGPGTSDPEPEMNPAADVDEASATTPSASSQQPAAAVRRRARVPGPALSFWTGLEAASAHNDSRTAAPRARASRRRRDVNGAQALRVPAPAPAGPSAPHPPLPLTPHRVAAGGFPDLSLQLQNGMFDSHVAAGDELFTQLPRRPFLVDGAFEEPVPVMEYTASFPFAYIARLHALALEFPLDDERYKLLLLLPVERQGLRQLLQGLNRVPLREVQRALRPTRVQAVVPAFMVEGFVILTPTLQQLGIWDLFDPRRADLSGMTDDPDLYVRNIEQAVTVVVKNYVEILDIQTQSSELRGNKLNRYNSGTFPAGPVHRHSPIPVLRDGFRDTGVAHGGKGCRSIKFKNLLIRD
ncbi:Leukocyte elastase inhibitor C [Frankliniella fusca]|uniref:Leukocyte elastase inhibitor C n=1 Tax=Frankliniella fusca TaxID=407009 RepID=A0AAE1GRF8_9NEOP|nr:Leukocyte elastase inhibitor C [Frankliniella fusca]